jgi:hypothetical protein
LSQLDDKPLNKININQISKQETMSLLGKPDVIRNNGKIWIYSGGKDVAFTLFILPQGGLYDHKRIRWLFLRFNEQDRLAEKEMVDSMHGCTKSHYCLPDWPNIGWRRIKEEWRLINNKTILLIPEDNKDKIPVVGNDHCRYFLYGMDDRDWIIFRGDDGFTLYINGYGPYRLNFRTFTYIDLPAGNMSLKITDIDKPTNINNGKNIAYYQCNAGETRYLSLRFTNKKKTDEFKQSVNFIEVEPDSADKILIKSQIFKPPRQLIVNP